MNQAHEQSLKQCLVLHILLNRENESALARWKLCFHKLSLIISEYEEVIASPEFISLSVYLYFPMKIIKHSKSDFQEEHVNS